MDKVIQDALDISANLLKENKITEAEFILNRIIKVDHDNAPAVHFLALIEFRRKNIRKSIEYFEKAIELEPDNPDNYNDVSLCYAGLNKMESAIEVSNKAIELDPKPIYYNNLALHYKNLGRYEEALGYICKSIEINPDFALSWQSRGNIHLALKDLELAEYCAKKSIEIDPKNPIGYGDLANIYFLKGDWDIAWPLYEKRLEHFEPALYFNNLYGPKIWKGEPLEGKKLAIHCEQGQGDFIHFLRYIPELQKLGCEIIIQAAEEAKSLIEENFKVRVETKKIEEFDYHTSIISIPCYLKIDVPSEPYIKRNAIGNFSNYADYFKIGIVWGGNPINPNDKYRSCLLSYFKEMHNIPGVKLFSLQKDIRLRSYFPESEHVDLAAGCEDMKVVNLAEFIKDFSDTAAFINGLDLVVSVDTSVLHLAGAMGRPVWALIPYHPDWRWGMKSSTTKLYPSMTLFRQEKFDNWESCFVKVNDAVKKLASSFLS